MALLTMAAVSGIAQPTPATPPTARGAMRFFMRGPHLGIGVMDVDNDRARALKLKEVRGAEVTRVDHDSPAEKAGIKVGDVILEYNGQNVQGTQELIKLVTDTPSGHPVKIVLWRNGGPVTVTAAPEEATMPGFDPNEWPFGGNMPQLPAMPPIDIPHIVTTFQSSVLGADCESLAGNPQLAEFFGVKDGLLVRSVARNSAAEKAGIKAGDVIVKLGDTHTATNRDLAAALRAARATPALPVTVVRNRHEMTVNVTLQDSGREHF
jgi:serine protease Do